tara:strand:- start:1297 stop:1923 length:627 start_codon:yes stop_codon:yes gene_type:complete
LGTWYEEILLKEVNGLNRDTAIVVIAVVALVLVSYQAGYIPFADNDTSEKVDSEPLNETENETSPSSLDEIHPLATTCLTHGGLTRHDHMYLYIQINGESVTIPENTGVYTETCNEEGAEMHVVHTHTSDGKLHLEMQTNETVELGVFFDIWGQHFDETGIFDYRVNETHAMTMSVRDSDGNISDVDTYDHFILLDGQDILIDYGPRA